MLLVIIWRGEARRGGEAARRGEARRGGAAAARAAAPRRLAARAAAPRRHPSRGFMIRLMTAAGIKDASNRVRQLKVAPVALPITGALQYK